MCVCVYVITSALEKETLEHGKQMDEEIILNVMAMWAGRIVSEAITIL